MIGRAGNDNLDGGGAQDILIGDAGNDNLDGGGAQDILIGRAGNDNLDGGGAQDILIGGAGSDNIYGGGGDDKIFHGPEDEVIVLSQTHTKHNTFKLALMLLLSVVNGITLPEHQKLRGSNTETEESIIPV